MCGRFAQTTPPDDLVRLFRLVMGLELSPRFNLAPTQDIVGIQTLKDGRHARLFRWGLVPSWAPDLKVGSKMINARSETVFEKRSFAKPARLQRCVIPASGFYEWRDTPAGKRPTLFRPAQDEILAFAGIWSPWANTKGDLTWTASILTTEANPAMAPFHHRMPVLLRPEGVDLWLDTDITEPEPLRPLFTPAPDDALSMLPVSIRVNNVRNDDAACWAPPD